MICGCIIDELESQGTLGLLLQNFTEAINSWYAVTTNSSEDEIKQVREE